MTMSLIFDCGAPLIPYICWGVIAYLAYRQAKYGTFRGEVLFLNIFMLVFISVFVQFFKLNLPEARMTWNGLSMLSRQDLGDFLRKAFPDSIFYLSLILGSILFVGPSYLKLMIKLDENNEADCESGLARRRRRAQRSARRMRGE